MPALRLHNVTLKVSKLKAIQELKWYHADVTNTPTGVVVLRQILSEGITIQTYLENAYKELFDFTSVLVESEEERIERLRKEKEEKTLQAALEWLTNLDEEKREFVRALQRQYIPRA